MIQTLTIPTVIRKAQPTWPPISSPETPTWGTATLTSSQTQAPADYYNRLASAVVLVASGITNAAFAGATPEIWHLRVNGANQITSSSAPYANNVLYLPHDTKFGSAAPLRDDPRESPSAEAIAELRLVTGFTWDQIARLFGVSRRSVHLWASGGAMSRENEEHLHRVLAIVRRSDCGRTGSIRAVLLTAKGSTTQCPFDLLSARDYDTALRALGAAIDVPQALARRFVPSQSILNERAPLAPEVLLDAKPDNGPMTPRRARAVRYGKVARDS